MAGQDVMVPISDSISKALERLFKAGGFALAFGFFGMLLIVFASVANENLRMPIFYVGCVLTFVCLVFFLLSSIRTREVTKRIKDDLPLLDAVQSIALQVTDLSSLSQSVAFKHLTTIQEAVARIIPLVESVPVVGLAVKNSGIADATKVSAAITKATEGAKEIIRGVENAIRSGNIKQLREYSDELRDAIALLRTLLKT